MAHIPGTRIEGNEVVLDLRVDTSGFSAALRSARRAVALARAELDYVTLTATHDHSRHLTDARDLLFTRRDLTTITTREAL